MSLQKHAIFGDPTEILLAISGEHHLPELLPLAVRLLAPEEQVCFGQDLARATAGGRRLLELPDGPRVPSSGEVPAPCRQLDVRIIAATNRNLRQESAEGRFRQDLYYRLSVFPIELAPLRERIQDIPLLAEHFLKRFARQLGRKTLKLTLANVQQLQRYHWPGNVRELQQLLERAVIISTDGKLRFDLPEDMRPLNKNKSQPPSIPPSAQSKPDQALPDQVMTDQEMRSLEADNIRRALAASGGKVYGRGGAAELLGLKPTTLLSMIRAFGIRN